MLDFKPEGVRPAECGACYARIYHRDLAGQYDSATNFSPRLRQIAGILIAQERAGKDGVPFDLYKLRTMRDTPQKDLFSSKDPVSVTSNRVTKLGRFLRKYWIDELPQLYNLLKGDLKLIGLRSVTLAILNVFPKEYQERRIKFKPGLISIAYADPRKDLDGKIAAEQEYMANYEKNPFRTDCLYFCKFIYNVIFKGVRSK